ncbi:MAG: PilT/PilU family type 4a pilus ATPase [Myxococcales bacterium]
MDEQTFHALLAKGAQHKASDVLLKVGQPPAFRVGGDLHYMNADKLKAAQTQRLAEIVLSQTRFSGSLLDLREYDCSYAVQGVGRYRVNIFRQRQSLALAMRAIPHTIPTFDQLGTPAAVRNFAELERGLVLVVGAAGNGKSSTLAAVIGEMNRTRRLHIVTIEDPIEFIHTDALSSVSQREVGLDTESFASALRSALRQDPDVILMGEIRDEETMDTALKAAETGHLVLSSLHTPDVARTVGRVISLCGSQDPQEIRDRFGDALKGIVAQRLLPRVDGGMCAATEVLVNTPTARESIKKPDGNLPLKDVMERGTHPYGMQTFEMHVKELVRAGIISVETARATLG